MGKELQRNVTVHVDGVAHSYKPGDEVPDEHLALIENDKVFEAPDGETVDEPEDAPKKRGKAAAAADS